MPRTARKKSISNIYHVTMRGINRQQIFEDSSDYLAFLQILKACAEVSGFLLHTYCLMGNHVHLLIEVEHEELGLCIKRICDRFTAGYNKKYDRTGHLFQNRYNSEPVESLSYFLTVFRYILQNPLRAGLETSVGASYRWSSLGDYQRRDNGLTYTAELRNHFSSHREMMEYLRADNYDQCQDYDEDGRIIRITSLEQTAREIIWERTACNNVSAFQRLTPEIQNACMRELKENGVSVRTISRLTGSTRYHISKL